MTLRKCATTLILLSFIGTAWASLAPGSKAPDFSAPASLGGQTFNFSLSAALRQGPVVLYFYPAAFTAGCTVEAHEFADAIERFKGLHATVIGVSHDPIETLNKFSVSECRSKFPVAADPDLAIAKSYDATLWFWPGHANRTTYLIAPDGSIIFSYSAQSPDGHIRNTLQALEQWSQRHSH